MFEIKTCFPLFLLPIPQWLPGFIVFPLSVFCYYYFATNCIISYRYIKRIDMFSTSFDTFNCLSFLYSHCLFCFVCFFLSFFLRFFMVCIQLYKAKSLNFHPFFFSFFAGFIPNSTGILLKNNYKCNFFVWIKQINNLSFELFPV